MVTVTTTMKWEVSALSKYNKMLNLIPIFHRGLAKEVVNKKAEQNALAARNKLEQIKYEAQQAEAKAQGTAKAIQIEAAALQNNPQVLQLRALEKWNGILPQFMGSGAVPFVQIK